MTQALPYYVYVYYDARPDKIGVPIYVGKGTPDRRARSHLSYGRNNLLRKIIRKHRELGLEPTIKIVARFATEAEAFAHEIMLIAKYGRRDLGTGTLCNHTDGGEGLVGLHLTPAQRRKMAKIASATLLKLHKSKTYRAALSAGHQAYWADPDNRTAHSKRMQTEMRKPERLQQIKKLGFLIATDPTLVYQRSKRLMRLNSDPEFKAARSAQMRIQNADSVFQACVAKKHRIWANQPEVIKQMKINYKKNADKILTAVNDYWDKPESRKAQAKRMSENNVDPAHLAKIKAGQKAWWADPKNRAAHAARLAARNRAKAEENRLSRAQ